MMVLGPSYIRSHKLLSAIVALPENKSVQVYNMCTLENLKNLSYVALLWALGLTPEAIFFSFWQLDRLENCLVWLMIAI